MVRKRLAAAWRAIRAHPGAAATVILVLIVGGAAAFVIADRAGDGETDAAGLIFDTPPGEYLFLDQERVLAYMGQLRGGLAKTAIQTEKENDQLEARLKGGSVAEIGRTRQTERSVQEEITPTATDRFYRLLASLIDGRSPARLGRSERKWLREVDVQLREGNELENVREELSSAREGDFLRIENARLFLPPYAALLPRARYASLYLGGRLRAPRRSLDAPDSPRGRRDLARYVRLLGRNPRLPFVVPTLRRPSRSEPVVTFLVPTPYAGLADEPRMLAGNLTIVGKLIYKDLNPPIDGPCNYEPGACYQDRQTVGRFGAALQKAPGSVLENLGMTKDGAIASVLESMTFRVPLAVVMPVAIYQ